MKPISQSTKLSRYDSTKLSKYDNKTFQSQQNISLTKQTYSRDPLQLTNNNWAYLYQSMKQRGINQKQLKNNINKYQANILSLVQSSQFLYFDKVSMSKQSMKQKISQYNQQLKIRMSEMFQFISMLHMQQLQISIQYLFNSLLNTVQKIIDSIQSLKQSNYRLQKQLEDWKLRKKNILCFSCKTNVQQAKLRNLTSQIGSTISQQVPTQLTDHQHQVKKIQSQCRNLQMQLNAMSEQHFFNSQSDHLIQLINEVLKTRINNIDKQQRKQNTITVLSKCLTDFNDLVKPLQIDYTPLQSGKDIQSSKKLGSTLSTKILSIKDLSDNQQYINKLKYLFSQPIHKFITKYQKIIQSRYKSILQKQSVQHKQQQTQTSLIKQPQLLKILQKQVLNLNKQLSTIKISKQKNQKQLLRVLDLLQKNQSKIIQITSKYKLIQNQNNQLLSQIKLIKIKFKLNQKQYQAQKQSLFNQFLQEKSIILKQISYQQQQINTLNTLNIQRLMRLKLQSKQVQTYASSFIQKKSYIDLQTQTDYIQFPSQNIKSNKKNMLKTLRSIKIKSKATNQFQQSDYNKSVTSTGQNWRLKKQHLKSKSQIPLNSDKNSLTSKKFIQQQYHHQLFTNTQQNKMIKTAPYGQNIFKKQLQGFQPFDGHINKQNNQEYMKKILMKKPRKPSINSMIPQSKQNSKSYLTNKQKQQDINKQKQQNINKYKQQDTNRISIYRQNSDMEQNDNIKNSYNIGLKSIQGLYLQGIAQFTQPNIPRIHKHQRTYLSSSYQNRDQQYENIDDQFNERENINILQHFNDISNILTSNGNKQNSLVSKLKKLPKNQFNQVIGRDKSNNGKKKVVIKSSLQTPKNIKGSLNSIIDPLMINKLLQIKHNQVQKHQIGIQAPQLKLNNIVNKNSIISIVEIKINQKKQQFTKLIHQQFQYLNNIGLIQLLQQANHQLYHQSHHSKILTNADQQKNIINFKSIIKNTQLQSNKYHIIKIDLQLFFSLQQASKYQNKIGLWNQLESCIIIDTNFSKITQEVDKYFQYLKQNKRSLYNQYIIFLLQPFKFIKDILDQKNCNIQKQRIMKQIIKLQKNHPSIVKHDFIKQTFKKLIKLHKVMHKTGCGHVQKFLQKIGFYQFKLKQLSHQQTPQINIDKKTFLYKQTQQNSKQQNIQLSPNKKIKVIKY